MESKKINKILVAVSIVLIVAFVVCALYAFFVPFTSFTEIISAISSFFVAGLTIIYVYTTSKQMDFMKQQLEQMRDEQRMREQPVIDISTSEFVIERPRLFCSPYDGYSFQARYYFNFNASNISEYPAVFVDVSAQLIVVEDKQELYLPAASERLNIVPARSESEQAHILFAGDIENRVLTALRSNSIQTLPKLKKIITYKSLSGANYVIEHLYHLDHDNEEIIKNWHATIVASPIEEAKNITLLKSSKIQSERDEIFEEIQVRFNEKLLGEENLKIKMVEIPNAFSFNTIPDEDFNNIMEKHHYGRYVGSAASKCEATKK